MVTLINPPLHLLGPTTVGKGLMTYLLENAMKLQKSIQIGIVAVGDEVRERFKRDPEFKKQYEPVVREGDLVPDKEIIPMFDGRLTAVAQQPFVVTDGFFRNVPQVEHASQNGLLRKGSACVVMHGRRDVCHRRLEDRLIRQANGARIDEHQFEKRFHFYQKTLGFILEAILRTKTKVLHVNADGDLEKEVFPQILSFANAVLAGDYEREDTQILMSTANTQYSRQSALRGFRRTGPASASLRPVYNGATG